MRPILERLQSLALAAEAKGAPVTAVLEADADDARAVLEACAFRNRPVSQRMVARFRDDMTHGRWVFDASPARFGTNLELLDAQHRFHALAGAGPGVRLRFLVVVGLPVEAQLVMDQGARRTPGGQLLMLDQRNGTAIAAAARPFMRVKAGAAVDVSTPAIVEFVAANDVLVKAYCDVVATIRRTEFRPAPGGALFMLCAERSEAQAVEFFHALADGGAAKSSPINILDRRLRRARQAGVRLGDLEELGYGLTAWNLYRRGESMAKLQAPRGGVWGWDTLPPAL